MKCCLMIEIVIYEKDPTEVMEIVRQLRERGLTQGKDFDFAYHKPTFDNFSYEAVHRRHTVFTFYDDKQATLFSLRYS